MPSLKSVSVQIKPFHVTGRILYIDLCEIEINILKQYVIKNLVKRVPDLPY